MYLADVFSDNMVLQRNVRVPVWGWADTGREVKVTLGGQQRSVLVPDGGYWRVELDPIDVGPATTLTVTDGVETVMRRNVVAGDVWLVAGQSNMGIPLRDSLKSEGDIAAANLPDLRLFQAPMVGAAEPQVAIDAAWQASTPETAAAFSAIGFYVGRAIHQHARIPIGLIQVTVGGSWIECFMRRAVLESHPDLQPILEHYHYKLVHWRQAVRSAREKAKAEGQSGGQSAQPEPRGPTGTKTHPSGWFNGMMAPLIPYALRGLLWYQGDQNVARAYQYRILFEAMIKDTRSLWDRADLPVVFMQTPNYSHPETGVCQSTYGELREALAAALKLPNTYMAVTIDIGITNDIHTPNKKDFGDRMARVALRELYGGDIPAYGPRYRAHVFEKGGVRVDFTNAEGGLRTRDGEPPRGFALAGDDRVFHPAQAAIEGQAVVVRCEQVPRPVSVRYAWAAEPRSNLCNRDDLPAAPFRTDGWPGVTDARR